MVKQLLVSAAIASTGLPALADEYRCPSIAVVGTFDHDNSFSLDWGEYQELAALRFNTFDANGNQILEKDEAPSSGQVHPSLHAGQATALPLPRHVFEAGLAGFFEFADIDENDQIQLSEYRRLCREKWIF